MQTDNLLKGDQRGLSATLNATLAYASATALRQRLRLRSMDRAQSDPTMSEVGKKGFALSGSFQEHLRGRGVRGST